MSQLNWVKITNNKIAIQEVPLSVGVYRYWAGDKIIYVGKSVTLRARLNSHAQNAKLDIKEKAIVETATHIDYTTTDNEFKALLLEAEEIKNHQPLYNRILKDDKSYLYIVINLKDKYPKPRLLRASELSLQKDQAIKTYGPFPSTQIAESVLKSIRHLIPYCIQKTIGKRACFYSHLDLCNPCPSVIEHIKIVSEKNRLQKLYINNIKKIIHILDGHYEPVVASLQKQITTASNRQDYETALKLKNKINSFKSYITAHSFSDRRVLSYHSPDSALTSLARHLGVRPLSRIECYDASHFSFQESVVAMTVATNGELNRAEYRRFRLKRPNKSDFAQLEEALTRRLKHTSWPRPNLIVIDGGKPQLRKLQTILDQIKNPPLMIGLVKHPDHLIVPHYDNSNYGSITYTKLHLSINDPGLNLLQNLRDEAHRFGNKYRLILNKKQKVPRRGLEPPSG